ncbi:MAG: hypothetical protein R2867_30765 [Caldilineaceae bacterium]
MMDELFAMARNKLTHVFWIGGPGCSGKSSVADQLSRTLDLQVYHVDDQMPYQKPEPDLKPVKWRDYDFGGKKGKPLFDLPPADVAQYVIDNWQTHIFVQTINHLLTWPTTPNIVVEGVFLPETLLKIASKERLAFMVSSRTFRKAYFGHRRAWYAAYEDKPVVYQTILNALEVMDQAWVEQATQFELPIFQITSLQTIDDVAIQTASLFQSQAV